MASSHRTCYAIDMTDTPRIPQLKLLLLPVLSILLAGFACGTAGTPTVTPLPDDALGLPTAAPSDDSRDEDGIEMTATAPATSAPTAPPEPAQPEAPPTQPVAYLTVDADEFGFSLDARADFLAVTLENGLAFFDAVDRRIWFRVTRDAYGLTPDVVDEEIADRLLGDVRSVDPAARFYEPYRFALDTIQNGRASDYVYVRDGEVINGSLTVGTALDNTTWVVQWEAPQAVYADYVEDFVMQFETLDITR